MLHNIALTLPNSDSGNVYLNDAIFIFWSGTHLQTIFATTRELV